MNTKEFAKLCGVEKRTLFYYDELGILKPLHVHENNYREYSSEQLWRMDMIKLLQASGYKLKEICNVLKEDKNVRREHFFSAEEQIDKKIAELQEMKAYIHRKKQLLNEYLEFIDTGKEYVIKEQSISYSAKPITENTHYFSFLSDGSYDSAILDGEEKASVYKEDPQGTLKEGKAVSFFLEISIEAQMLDEIEARMKGTPFRGDGMYFVSILPVLLLDDNGRIVIKATTFEENEE